MEKVYIRVREKWGRHNIVLYVGQQKMKKKKKSEIVWKEVVVLVAASSRLNIGSRGSGSVAECGGTESKK